MSNQGWPGNATKTIVINYALANPNASPREIADWFEFSYSAVRDSMRRAGLRTNFGARKAHRGPWTTERINKLREMWLANKLSAAAIARELGVSRQAVIGQKVRLRLAPRRIGWTAHSNPWTTERIEKLRELWLADELSAAEIARELGGGISKAAVIRKKITLQLPNHRGGLVRKRQAYYFSPLHNRRIYYSLLHLQH